MKVNKYIRVKETIQETKQQEKEDNMGSKEQKGNNSCGRYNSYQRSNHRDDGRKSFDRVEEYNNLEY